MGFISARTKYSKGRATPESLQYGPLTAAALEILAPNRKPRSFCADEKGTVPF
jgi:hypothetical protein